MPTLSIWRLHIPKRNPWFVINPALNLLSQIIRRDPIIYQLLKFIPAN